MIQAIYRLKNNDAAGLDEVAAEILKHGGGNTAVEKITHLFNLIWQDEEVIEDWGD